MKDILIIHFGTRFITNLENGLKSRHICFDTVPYEKIGNDITGYKGVILSGSPYSAYTENSPSIDKSILEQGTPVLGICYGMQLIAHLFGKKVDKAERGEHVLTRLKLEKSILFEGMGEEAQGEMRHSDRVYEMPSGFRLIASTADCPIAGMEDSAKKIYAVQFHPELGGCGDNVLDNFYDKICKCRAPGHGEG